MASKKSGSSQPIARWRGDPVAFITEVLRNPETSQPFALYPAQVEFQRRAFTLPQDGHLAFPEMIFSAPKKSGKTALAAMCAIYVAVVAAALKVQWPTLAIQRCTNHKLWNLLAKAPAHLREELAEDYRRMIYATSREGVEQARVGFLGKWKLRCKAVSVSFEEAGDELFTFTAFPSSQWKALRTTNVLERINEEFRRRTKTQASLPSEEAVLFLLFGLLRSGQVRLRRLVG
jgi:hypothetical protein